MLFCLSVRPFSTFSNKAIGTWIPAGDKANQFEGSFIQRYATADDILHALHTECWQGFSGNPDMFCDPKPRAWGPDCVVVALPVSQRLPYVTLEGRGIGQTRPYEPLYRPRLIRADDNRNFGAGLAFPFTTTAAELEILALGVLFD